MNESACEACKRVNAIKKAIATAIDFAFAEPNSRDQRS